MSIVNSGAKKQLTLTPHLFSAGPATERVALKILLKLSEETMCVYKGNSGVRQQVDPQCS